MLDLIGALEDVDEEEEVTVAREACEQAAASVEEAYERIVLGEAEDLVRMERNGGRAGRAEEEACEDAVQETMQLLASILCFDGRYGEAQAQLERVLDTRIHDREAAAGEDPRLRMMGPKARPVLDVLEQLGETLRAQAKYEESHARLEAWVREDEADLDRVPLAMRTRPQGMGVDEEAEPIAVAGEDEATLFEREKEKAQSDGDTPDAVITLKDWKTISNPKRSCLV